MWDKARDFAARHLKPGFANLEVVSPENQPTPDVSDSEENAPPDAAELLAAVTTERDQLQAEVAELQDRMLRRQAEFENFRRRQERDLTAAPGPTSSPRARRRDRSISPSWLPRPSRPIRSRGKGSPAPA